MTKSATDVMHDILFSAVTDAIVALKAASKGLPNNLLRDLNAIHANTTVADLPPELRAAIDASVKTAFARLLKEGYSVAPRQAGASAPRPASTVPPRGGRPSSPPAGKRPGGPPRPKGPAGAPGGAPGKGRPRGPKPPSRG